MTNLLATILLTLTTNTTEHWPQVMTGAERPAWANPVTLESYVRIIDNTNSDTKSVEFTVTAQKLVVERHDLINLFYRWLNQRGPEITGRVESGLELHNPIITNEVTAHWQVDYKRVRTNVWVIAGYSNVLVKVVPGVIAFRNDHDNLLLALVETNWFEPVMMTTNHIGGPAK